jgi:hypothetical protein
MHLDDERVQRLLHGELEPADERLARQHLAGCADCRVVVDDARADEHAIFGLLREVDHPLPDADPRAILAVGKAPRARWERWAAGFLLVAVAGGAAYAAPGSPLPAVLDRLVGWVTPAQTPSAPPAPTGGGTPSGAGIAVAPGERLTIRFAGDRDSAVATVSLTDGDEVVVRAVEGSAAFTSDLDRLSVQSTGRARFEILIPRSAPSVEIVAGEHPVFRVDASRVVTEAPPDAEGRYVLPLSIRGP